MTAGSFSTLIIALQVMFGMFRWMKNLTSGELTTDKRELE